MNIDRRGLLQCGAGLLAWLAGLKAYAQGQSHPAQHEQQGKPEKHKKSKPRPKEGFVSVKTPDIPKLPYKLENGVKIFDLVAEPVRRDFLPGKTFDVWGYNGNVPGPTIEGMEGDRV